MTRHRIQLASRLGALLIAAAWLLGGGVAAWAAVKTYNVNSTADLANSTSSSTVCATAGSNPVCTLRAAIQASNANQNQTDTIVLPAGVYTLTIPGRNENAAATGDLDIMDAVNITGAGASSVIIDGNGIDRVFDVFANGTTTISGVTIRNGNPGGTCSTTKTQICVAAAGCPQGQTCILASGGGIQTGGAAGSSSVVTLNLSRVVVTRNTSGPGGGIANSDILSLTDVTVSDNTCAGTSCFGGGIFNMNGSTSSLATLNRVTLSGNSATGGGGLGSDANVNFTNVTIYDNSADSGAGIYQSSGTATLVNVTISNNNAVQGGGAFFSTGDVTFKYTIFAHDPPSEACQNFGTSFTSGGRNIDVGTSCEPLCIVPTDCPSGTTCKDNLGNTVSSSCPSGQTCLCIGSGDIINTDPALAPLANNGGPTFTQALVAGSPALDKGGTDCPPPATDQRSFPRPGTAVAKCDIGAFEHQSTDPFPTTSTTTSTTTTSTTTTRPPTTTSSTSSSTTTSTLPPPTTTTSTTAPTTTTTRPPTTTTTTTSTTTSTTTMTILCGDVNGSGSVGIADALLVAQYTVGLRTCGVAPFNHPEVCDVNRDNGCNIGDALRMAQCEVGLISCTFSCTPFSCP